MIERTLDALPETIDEIFIAVNHLREQIIDFVGADWNGVKVTYVVQEPLSGTAGAILLLKEHLVGPFLVVNSDDLYDPRDLSILCEQPWALLYFPTHEEKTAGALVESQRFIGLERSKNAVCGAYVLGREFFDVEPVEIQVSQYREYGLPQTLARLATCVDIAAVHATSWQQVGTHEQLQQARTTL